MTVMGDRKEAVMGDRVLVGDTIKCPACGEAVTVEVQEYSNLTVLLSPTRQLCTDGNVYHEWPEER